MVGHYVQQNYLFLTFFFGETNKLYIAKTWHALEKCLCVQHALSPFSLQLFITTQLRIMLFDIWTTKIFERKKRN